MKGAKTELDYLAIGRRIRQSRKGMGLTQQALSKMSCQEPSNVSHIETGRTRLSLPTLVRIANALGISVDEIICDSMVKAKDIFHNEIANEVQDCSEQEIRIIAETIKGLKAALRKGPQMPQVPGVE